MVELYGTLGNLQMRSEVDTVMVALWGKRHMHAFRCFVIGFRELRRWPPKSPQLVDHIEQCVQQRVQHPAYWPLIFVPTPEFMFKKSKIFIKAVILFQLLHFADAFAPFLWIHCKAHCRRFLWALLQFKVTHIRPRLEIKGWYLLSFWEGGRRGKRRWGSNRAWFTNEWKYCRSENLLLIVRNAKKWKWWNNWRERCLRHISSH